MFPILHISSFINSAAQPSSPKPKSIYLTTSSKIQPQCVSLPPNTRQPMTPQVKKKVMEITPPSVEPPISNKVLPYHRQKIRANSLPPLPNFGSNFRSKLWSSLAQIKPRKKKPS